MNMVSSHRFPSPEGNKTYTNYLIVKEHTQQIPNNVSIVSVVLMTAFVGETE